MLQKFVVSIAGSALALTSGCSLLQPDTQTQSKVVYEPSPYVLSYDSESSHSESTTTQHAIEPSSYPARNRLYASHKLLDDYVAELAMQLYHSSTHAFADNTVAVAGFADVTPGRDTLQPLGNALAELFLQQMPRYGVTMVDHKLTGSIALTASGDRVFSNRSGQVSANQQIDYVLSGTVQHSHRGAYVNVRIMHLKNKTVLASASQLIPQFVLESAPLAMAW
tara:strand:- start:571 stop:1239 length:669 start_codon:yes stop_codon:yes gene_type:complete